MTSRYAQVIDAEVVHEFPASVEVGGEYGRAPAQPPRGQPLLDQGARVRRLDAVIRTLTAAITSSSAELEPPFVQAWAAFARGWTRFRFSARLGGEVEAFALLRPATRAMHDAIDRRLVEYEARVVDWFNAAAARGVRVEPTAVVGVGGVRIEPSRVFEQLAVAGVVGLSALVLAGLFDDPNEDD